MEPIIIQHDDGITEEVVPSSPTLEELIAAHRALYARPRLRLISATQDIAQALRDGRAGLGGTANG